MPRKLESFEIKDGDKKVQLALLQVDADVGRKALQEYNRAFSSAVKSGALLRSALKNFMVEQNVWNDEKESQYDNLVKVINENADKLARGGIKLSEARSIALDSRRARAELRELISERTQLDTNTAEGQAENARFNYIVSQVTVDDLTGEKYFKDLDDYLSRASSEIAVEAAQRLGQIMYGLDPNYEKSLPENKFLRKWKFVDDDLRLINKDGHLIDLDGRLINEDGRYVDAEGNFVDRDGNPITEDGDLKVSPEPFLDDNGDPIVDSESSLESEEVKESSDEFGGALLNNKA